MHINDFKKKKTVKITIRMEEDMITELKLLANKDGRDPSDYIRRLIQHDIENHKRG
jgi:predicted DNA-binding protein